MLMHKYGREFSAAATENRDGCVSDRVRLEFCSRTLVLLVHLKVARKIEVKTPSADLVNAYMGEIAKAYSVAWEAPQSTSKESDDNSNSGNGHGDGGVKVRFHTLSLTLFYQGPEPDTLARFFILVLVP